MLMEILRLYFPFCYRPVLLFLCYFTCSPSFLLFHLHSFLCIKSQSLSSTRAFFRAERARSKTFLGASTPCLFLPPHTGSHGPLRFFRLEPPLCCCSVQMLWRIRYVCRCCASHCASSLQCTAWVTSLWRCGGF